MMYTHNEVILLIPRELRIKEKDECVFVGVSVSIMIVDGRG